MRAKGWHKTISKFIRSDSIEQIENLPSTLEQSKVLRSLAKTVVFDEKAALVLLREAQRLRGPTRVEVTRWVQDRERNEFDGPSFGAVPGNVTFGPLGHMEHVGWRKMTILEWETHVDAEDERESRRSNYDDEDYD
jgi:hypothetical protein